MVRSALLRASRTMRQHAAHPSRRGQAAAPQDEDLVRRNTCRKLTMPIPPPLRLGVNVDHIATLRNARAGERPDPVRAALVAIEAGADGITAHLREDRRHIRDDDMARLKAEISKPLNFEMAATEDMLRIALATRPHAVWLVPERREELTTEGGLDVVGQHNLLAPFIARLNDAGVRVSLFIAADPAQIEMAA